MAPLRFDLAMMQIGEGNHDQDAGNKDSDKDAFHRVLRWRWQWVNLNFESVPGLD